MNARHRLAALGAGLLAACSAPEKPPPVISLDCELVGPPALVATIADSDSVYFATTGGAVGRVDGGTMSTTMRQDALTSLPVCLAADALGGFAVGANSGDADVHDGGDRAWTMRRRLPSPMRSPVAAIGMLAAPAAQAGPAPTEGDRATTPRQASPVVVLIARYPGKLTRVVFPAGDAVAPAFEDVELIDGDGKPAARAHLRAIVADATGDRWFLLADGEVHQVARTQPPPAKSDSAKAGSNAVAASTRVADAPGALALAWGGAQLAIAGGKGVELLDPRTLARAAMPDVGGRRFVQVAASDAFGAVAALDERGALSLWRRRAGGWRLEPGPTGAQAWSHVTMCERTSRVLLFGAKDAKGVVQRFDLAVAPIAAP